MDAQLVQVQAAMYVPGTYRTPRYVVGITLDLLRCRSSDNLAIFCDSDRGVNGTLITASCTSFWATLISER